jgi:type III pantothenate kinase
MIAPDGGRQADGAAGTLVVIGVGNSRVSMATYREGVRHAARHLPNEPFEAILDELDRRWQELPAATSRAVVVCSVCPPLLDKLRSGAAARSISPLLVLGEDIEPPIDADLPEPERIGMDRLCVAAAAYAGFKSACAVADFGTALTVDLVGDDGVFLGGTIAPGMALCARALHEHTALLPLVSMEAPGNEILGKDTTSAIRNGIHAMMIGALREITERYATDIGKWPPLVIAGGDAETIGRHCDFVDRVVPDLCLDGVVLAYQQHVSRSSNR